MKDKNVLVLVMSVGKHSDNHTVKWLEKIGGISHTIVCLPKQFEENAESYKKRSIEVYVYDEKKYINKDFEYFGFKPRNCGGIGRQGIAEATEKFGNEDNIILQIDDDTAGFSAAKQVDGKLIRRRIHSWANFAKIINAEQRFYEATGIECAGQTGASMPGDGFISNRKIFNNFIMRPGNRLNYDGFKALCSDDYRFNMMNCLLNARPMISHKYLVIYFAQNQGDRKDGNAVIYNSDFSWKKSYALKMIAPWAVEQRIRKEKNRVIFRENYMPRKLFPQVCLEDKNGKLIGRTQG